MIQNGTPLSYAIKAAIAGTALGLAGNAWAAGAVQVIELGHLMDPAGGTLTISEAGGKSTYANNPLLDGSSWGHAGKWYSFMTHHTLDVTVTVEAAGLSDFKPGFSVWASGDAAFDGGTADLNEIGTAGFNTPHSFNSVGTLGDFGTGWMSGTNGNLLETLGYANSGIDMINGGFGESIFNGAHDVSSSNVFENGITGTVSEGYAQLVFHDLQPGWYVIFTGGTNHASGGGLYDVTVSAVPVPAAVWLFGSGLLGLAGIARRKRS